MRVRYFLYAASLLLPAGCFLWSSGESAPAPIQITIRAASRLNPDEQGEPLPTAVRVYQLKGPTKFEAAEFGDLYDRDKAVLGDDMVQVDELVLAPGQEQSKRVARDKAARFVGVVAVVRRPAGSLWRSIAALPPAGKDTDLAFAVEGYRIERK
jgi:type VI secretion system protein VasD